MDENYQHNPYSNQGHRNFDYSNQYTNQVSQNQNNNFIGGEYGYNNYQKGSTQQQSNQGYR